MTSPQPAVGQLVPLYPEPEPAPGGDEQTWDAFWAEVKPAKTTTIRGVRVRVPSGMTLAAMQATEAQGEVGGWAGFQALAVSLFRAVDGSEIPGLVATWRAAGMELDELQVLCTWAMSGARGNPISFAEAHRLTERAKDEPAGKASTGGRSSAGTGGRSKPTSRGSTGSKRTSSPA